MSCACSAIGLAPLRYWGSPVELWGDCNLWPFTRHLFLAILLEAVVGHDGPFAFRLRACPVAGSRSASQRGCVVSALGRGGMSRARTAASKSAVLGIRLPPLSRAVAP